MPNTLVHLCIQTPASRLLFRSADFKWIGLGCIIPDIPWILQRIIAFALPGIDLIDLRIYAVIQASLFFCLLFSLALSLLTVYPGRIFLLLSFNALAHLLLDALQTKWANDVHLFAPFSWRATGFSSVWPEHLLIYGLSAIGFGVLIVAGRRDWKKNVRLTTNRIQWGTAVLLITGYFLLPFPMFPGPERENTHYIATLRNTEKREGRGIEIDRGRFRSSDNTIQVFSGERLRLHGKIPERDALLSIRGSFIDNKNIRVAAFHRHSRSRDLASLVALFGVLCIWLLAILKKKVTFTDRVSQ